MTTPSDPTPPPPTAPVTYWEAPKEDAGPAPGVSFAGHGGRLISYILDSLILGVIYLVIFFVLSAAVLGAAGVGSFDSTVTFDESGMPTRMPSGMIAAVFGLVGLVFLLTIVLQFVYFGYFWVRSGQTPGMRPFGLYVVRDSDGGNISWGQAILRVIGMWVAAIPVYLGFIWIFIDPRRRGWHDLIAGTVVIERAPLA